MISIYQKLNEDFIREFNYKIKWNKILKSKYLVKIFIRRISK